MLATRSLVTWYQDKFGWLRNLNVKTRHKPFHNDSTLHYNINYSKYEQYELKSVHNPLKWVQNGFKISLKLIISCSNGFKVTQNSSRMAQKLYKIFRELSKIKQDLSKITQIVSELMQNYAKCVCSSSKPVQKWGNIVQTYSIFAQNSSKIFPKLVSPNGQNSPECLKTFKMRLKMPIGTSTCPNVSTVTQYLSKNDSTFTHFIQNGSDLIQ